MSGYRGSWVAARPDFITVADGTRYRARYIWGKSVFYLSGGASIKVGDVIGYRNEIHEVIEVGRTQRHSDPKLTTRRIK